MSSNHESSEGGNWDGIRVVALTRVKLDPNFVTIPQIQDYHICSRLVRSATIGKCPDLGDAVLHYININGGWTIRVDSDVEDEETLCGGGEHPCQWVVSVPLVVKDTGEHKFSRIPVTIIRYSTGSEAYSLLAVFKWKNK